MALSRASTVACVTSASTNTCSPISRTRARSSKNGGPTKHQPTALEPQRAHTNRVRSTPQPGRNWNKNSPYERGQVGEQVASSAPGKQSRDRTDYVIVAPNKTLMLCSLKTLMPKPQSCVALPVSAYLIALFPNFGAVLTIEAKPVGSPESGADCYSENEDSLHCSGSPSCKA